MILDRINSLSLTAIWTTVGRRASLTLWRTGPANGKEAEAMGDRGGSGIKGVTIVRALALVGSLAALAVVFTAAVVADPHDMRGTLERYGRDTWASFVAMTDEETGLPADSLHIDGTRSVQTSTTNIGAYMWSTLVAEALGFVSHDDAVARLDRTLRTLEVMERHEPSGQFFNWYDHTTGKTLTVWPPSGEPLTPILSSVDNGWLATALHLVRNRIPELSERAGALFVRSIMAFQGVPIGSPSLTQPLRRTPMAWSPRMRPSWRCAGRPKRRLRTWPRSSATSRSIPHGDSATR
jgi:hypothetical protein